jgi:hypothetical protein
LGKIGANVVVPWPHIRFHLAEVVVPRELFAAIPNAGAPQRPGASLPLASADRHWYASHRPRAASPPG